MTAILLAAASAVTFGGMTVAVRAGTRGGTSRTAAAAIMLPALAVALVATLPRHDFGGLWPFLLAGILAPGLSQVLLVQAVRRVGASRTSVVLGAGPLPAVAIAIVFLDESPSAPLVAGALLIVLGGVFLAAERNRPGELRVSGLAFAAGVALAFAIRDNITRALHASASPESAAAATMVAGMVITLLYARRLPPVAEVRRLVPAGVLFAASYVFLFEAYFNGPVSVVSPLAATETLWGVGFAALVFGRSEGVGRRILAGALLVVAGGAMIGVFR